MALNLTGEMIAANLLSEGPESKADKELDDLTEAEAQKMDTTSDEEERVPFEKDDANMLVKNDLIVGKSELEPSFCSNNIDVEMILAEEGTVRSSDDGYVAIKKRSDDDCEE